MKTIEVNIVLPETSTDAVSKGLRILTEAIQRCHPEKAIGGGLGGAYGYGAEWNSDVFEMHPYCWCGDDDNCRWCGDEDAPNFHHKPSGFKVWWYKWIGREQRTEGDCDWGAVVLECLWSLGMGREPEGGLGIDLGAIERMLGRFPGAEGVRRCLSDLQGSP